jgi:hypothetical protein
MPAIIPSAFSLVYVLLHVFKFLTIFAMRLSGALSEAAIVDGHFFDLPDNRLVLAFAGLGTALLGVLALWKWAWVKWAAGWTAFAFTMLLVFFAIARLVEQPDIYRVMVNDPTLFKAPRPPAFDPYAAAAAPTLAPRTPAQVPGPWPTLPAPVYEGEDEEAARTPF